MDKKYKIVLIVLAIVGIVSITLGVSIAFFNYTRTGSANTVRTGQINFNHEQGNAINLTNVFPIDVTNGIPNNDNNVGSVTINVTGDTTYTDGIEYLVSAVNVNNTVGSGNNQKAVPISIDVSVTSNTNNDPATTLGTADESYFTNRGASSNTSIYKVLAKETISEDDQLLVGYIKSGSTGVDGNIVIRAYIDMSKVAISDTYPEGNIEINNLNYYNGTTSNWAGERVVITTDEWNALSSNGISFQVKVEANEGIWVEEPFTPQLASIVVQNTIGVSNIAGAYRYIGATVNNYVYFNCSDGNDTTTCETWRIIGTYNNNLKIVSTIPVLNKKWNDSNYNNSWDGSILKTYLNQETAGGYYYGLTQFSKNMIISGTWNVGTIAPSDTANDTYTKSLELTDTCYVAMVAPYEYMYATEDDGNCLQTYISYYTAECSQKNWLYPVLTNEEISDSRILGRINFGSSYATSTVVSDGSISTTGTYVEMDVYPTVYLNSSVKIIGGTGELTNPYRLG